MIPLRRDDPSPAAPDTPTERGPLARIDRSEGRTRAGGTPALHSRRNTGTGVARRREERDWGGKTSTSATTVNLA